MSQEITVKTVEPEVLVGVRITAKAGELGHEVSSAYQQIYHAIDQAGLVPAGPPRLVYYDLHEDTWTVEACAPLVQATEMPDGLAVHTSAGGRVAATVHTGSYDDIPQAYADLEKWVSEHDLTLTGEPYDIYLNSPADVSDDAELRTEIRWPVT
ncbi:GyrI-like domain-containing protein [Phytoactinopolyspora limicola]|uniref:GyrI-like domain-containing protein n=1 Tax=Phytoactinopolyspora limicola TaxID=2715536 RepID=UPI00140D44C6|nr:GyrI-like domain-containing protein [Phytoactinopolyspora limicola]